ncbi:conserved hypothetical protein [Ricinus communis]|uniref:Uncharacterized protein n=1 Tax=Ricinus communis TaxID=3988 RepID=B9RUZ5_RICCO|nr:conserved hypothetical protein [Ricinus communis]
MHLSRIFSAKISSLLHGFLRLQQDESSNNLLPSKNARTPPRRRSYVTVYVGEKSKKYKVPVEYLSFPEFQELIKNVLASELDIKIDGPIKFDKISTKKFDELMERAKKQQHDKLY